MGLEVQAIERFELAGTLNGHPGHVRSDEAKRPFGAIFALAVASRTAAEPLRTESLRTATAALLAWATVYRPTGNPIDEWFFIPLLQAADLIAPAMDPAPGRTVLDWVAEFATAGDAFFAAKRDRNPARANNYHIAAVRPLVEIALFAPDLITPDLDPADQRTALDWVAEFAVAGDKFFAAKHDRNSSRANNWMARRLLIRAVATTVAGLTSPRAELPGQLAEFTARNYIEGPSGQPDGRTFDFRQRDALNYHVAAVQPLVEITLYAPDLVTPGVRAAAASGLDFIRPYFLGEATHIEFVSTTVRFDHVRRDDGNPVFQPEPWDPKRGRVVLRLARPVFPEVRPWTEDIVDARYDPRTKLLAAIYGEPQRRAQWP